MSRSLIFLAALLIAVSGSRAAEPNVEIPRRPPAANLFDLSPADFAKRKDAQRQIDFQNVDHDLLSAAIFHETNARRARKSLPPLRHHPNVWRAAAIQAQAMRQQQAVTHQLRGTLRTPWDRVTAVGLDPQFVAENVATAFGLHYTQGEPLYTRMEGGRRVLSRRPGGPPIAPHGYVSFARALLDSWMGSRHHRENILGKEARFLGCASAPANRRGMPVCFCAQVFFTPIPPSDK